MHDKDGKFWDIENVKKMQFWNKSNFWNVVIDDQPRI